MYFFENEYLVSHRRHPYLGKEKVTQHNLFVKDVKAMTERAGGIEASIEKQNNLIASAIGSVPAIIFILYYLNNYWQKDLLMGIITLFFPSFFIFGLSFMVAYGILGLLSKNNSELDSLKSTIKENVEYLDNELRLFKELKKKQAQHWLNMNGHLFEKEVAELFRANGYEAQVTKGSGDGGIDIFLEKDGIRYGAQCKNYHGMVGPAPIRDLYGTMFHEKLEAGIFIASSGYTKGAKEFASNKPIQLLDINDVMRMHAKAIT